MCETLAIRQQKAKKRYVCIWCGEYILPGEVYDKVIGIVEGDFGESKYHQECGKACQEFIKLEEQQGEYCALFDPYSFKRGSIDAG